MDDMQNILKSYKINVEDIKNLKSIAPVMEQYKESLADGLVEFILSREETAKYFHNKDIKESHKKYAQEWFIKLFSGQYNNKYLHYLQKIGNRHVKEGVKVHYIHCAMNFIRTFTINTIENEIEDDDIAGIITSVNKMIDLNLDSITSFYREEELRTVFVSYRFEGFLIEFAKRFTYGLNLILVIALIFISFLVIGQFVLDFGHIFEGNVSEGVISAIGSLLILWVMIELLDTEIKHLRGGEFEIKVFVGVALVAFIRELLISSFQEIEGVGRQYFFTISIFILGVIYWLIARIEKRD